MKRILILEDDPIIQATLRGLLTEVGYATELAETIASARRLLREKAFELLIFDLTLPDGTSFDLCKEVRSDDPSLPIVLVTASVDEDSAVRGLSLGVSDYIRKPFGRRELLARVRRLLKEVSGQMDLGKLRVNLDGKTVSHDGQEIHLTPTEFQVLITLLERMGDPVGREKLMERIDPEGETLDVTLSSHISQLRAKLKEAGVTEIKISSVYGTGYRLEKTK